jgi:fructokinase
VAKVVGIAVEDEAIYHMIEEVGEREKEFTKEPTFIRRDRPYSKEFITAAIQQLCSEDGDDIEAVGISMFGLIRTDGGAEPTARKDALIAVPRDDWTDRVNTSIIFKDIVEQWRTIPVFVQNDSTTAAMAERFSRSDDSDSFVFVRLGTGIGVGALWKRNPRLGKVHPELGHIPVRFHVKEFLPEGTCGVHGKCLEGLVSNKAIDHRFRIHPPGRDPEESLVWELVAFYLGELCATITMSLAPDRIVIGGRTTRTEEGEVRKHLYDGIREHFQKAVGGGAKEGYPRYRETENLLTYIVPSKRRADAALWGAVELARKHFFPGIRLKPVRKTSMGRGYR